MKRGLVEAVMSRSSNPANEPGATRAFCNAPFRATRDISAGRAAHDWVIEAAVYLTQQKSTVTTMMPSCDRSDSIIRIEGKIKFFPLPDVEALFNRDANFPIENADFVLQIQPSDEFL